jgi:monovalent cation:H+ antiporter-2, CPA2 family
MSAALAPAVLASPLPLPTGHLTDLVLILAVAAICATVFQRLRLPTVLGYLAAGILVGPHLPGGLAVDPTLAHGLSDLGVILLMFTLGVEFSLRRLVRHAPSGVLVAVIECSLVGWLGYFSGRLLGWSVTESIFAGAVSAISSTTIVAKTFTDQGIGGRLGELVFSVLIAEDLIAILLLAVLTAVANGAGMSATMLGHTAGRLLGFLAVMLAVGMLVVPRTVRLIARGRRTETLLMSSLALALGLAWLAQRAGYSVAFGAFLAGALIAESGEAKQVEGLVRPIRQVFAAVFFVSVGMLIDLTAIRDHAGAVCVLSAVVIAGKVLGVTLAAFVAGNGIRLSLQSGMSLAQVGEFSFIIAGVGTAAGVLPGHFFPVVIAVSALTTLLTPLLFGVSGRFAAYVDRRLPHAVQTFATLYGAWLHGLAKDRGHAEWARIRRLAGFLALDVIAVAALVIVSSRGRAPLAEGVARWVPVNLGRALVTVSAIALALPFFWSALRIAQRLGRVLAEGAFPPPRSGVDLAEAPRRALRATLELAILFAVGAPLVALTQPFLPTAFPLAGVLVVGVVLLALPFWRSARNLDGHVRAGAQVVVEALIAQSRSGQSDSDKLEELRQLLPGIGEPRVLPLASGAAAIGRSLKDLNVRGLTGATALAIERKGEVVVATADEVLCENDVLVLTGTRDAVTAACDLLGRGARPRCAADGELVD